MTNRYVCGYHYKHNSYCETCLKVSYKNEGYEQGRKDRDNEWIKAISEYEGTPTSFAKDIRFKLHLARAMKLNFKKKESMKK